MICNKLVKNLTKKTQWDTSMMEKQKMCGAITTQINDLFQIYTFLNIYKSKSKLM
jgi:hypothetical protein